MIRQCIALPCGTNNRLNKYWGVFCHYFNQTAGHRARTQASDISHLEKLHNLTLWLDEPSKIWNKKRRDVFHPMFCSQFVPTSTSCVTGKHCQRRKKELIRDSAPCQRQSLSICPPTMNTQYQFKTEDYQRHSSQMTTS